jgi:glycerate dehydrogenase
MSPHIVFLDRSTLKTTVRRPAFAHTWDEYDTTSPAQVAERLHGAAIAISNKVPLRADVLAQLPHLKMIGVAATGYDIIDVPACRERGIVVSNIRNYAVHTVPEHTFALILALRRNILAYRQDVERGRWQEVDQFCFFDHPIHDLFGSTLGIFGAGALGQGTAKIARGFGMKVLFAEHSGRQAPGVEFTPVEQVLSESDIISLHCPLTPGSRHMFGMAQFRQMKRSAILINTARGGLVHEEDLVTALKTGIIGGAGFDVLTREPPKEGNPLLDLRLPNFILTPHVAWASDGAMQALADQLIDNIEAFMQGKPVNTVT